MIKHAPFQNYRFYTAADDNAVQIRIFKEGEPDGILTRFTAPVTALCFSKDGTKAIAGSRYASFYIQSFVFVFFNMFYLFVLFKARTIVHLRIYYNTTYYKQC